MSKLDAPCSVTISDHFSVDNIFIELADWDCEVIVIDPFGERDFLTHFLRRGTFQPILRGTFRLIW